MNLRKRLMILLPGAVLCAAVAMAQVPPTSVFQLDGKAPNSNLTCSYGQPCDYWNLLNGTGNNIAGGGVGAGSQSGHSSVRTFINGTSSTFSFQGGGSKDANLISQWTYAGLDRQTKTRLMAHMRPLTRRVEISHSSLAQTVFHPMVTRISGSGFFSRRSRPILLGASRELISTMIFS
jgi:hypothetical protein